MVSLSVVIPVHRANKPLGELLKALSKQSTGDFEVWAVNFSRSPMPPEFESLPSNFHYATIDSRWPGPKRNKGAQLASGSIVAFVDEDCLPDPDWAQKIISFFDRHPETDLLEGATTGEFVHLLGHSIENLSGGWFPTCNLAVRKKAFMELGGFDLKYDFFREDLDLAFQFMKAKKKIAFAPEVKVLHPERRIEASSLLREWHMVKGDARLAKKFPVLYREKLGSFWLGGGIKLGLAMWTSVVLFLAGFWIHWTISAGAILAWLLLRFFTGMRQKKATISEMVQYLVFSTIRDLGLPFFALKYWLERFEP